MKYFLISLLSAAVAAAAFLPDSPAFEHPRDLIVPFNEISGRIVNGQNAPKGEFPYQVWLSLARIDGSRVGCGGSLISASWVLTAAHCTQAAYSVNVSLGATILTEPEVLVTVGQANIITHEGWDSSTLSNDIALLQIPNVTLSNNIQPIPLPARSYTNKYPTYAGEEGIITGFGRMGDSATGVASHLQWARVPIISNAKCARSYGLSIDSSKICIATETNYVSSCPGDSGGALVSESSGDQVGLVSFGSGRGCELGYPVAFTRVTYYLEWIRNQTGIVN